jgi:hypothetical protein
MDLKKGDREQQKDLFIAACPLNTSLSLYLEKKPGSN